MLLETNTPTPNAALLLTSSSSSLRHFRNTLTSSRRLEEDVPIASQIYSNLNGKRKRLTKSLKRVKYRITLIRYALPYYIGEILCRSEHNPTIYISEILHIYSVPLCHGVSPIILEILRTPQNVAHTPHKISPLTDRPCKIYFTSKLGFCNHTTQPILQLLSYLALHGK